MADAKVFRSALGAIKAVGGQIRTLDVLAADATAALRLAPVGLTPAGAASFLATTAQESAYYRTTREYGSGQWYAPWIGRGFVQVTHERNYRDFGAWCHRKGLVSDPEIFVKNRAALEDYRYAWATACWYFEANGLWRYANKGDHYSVSQGVNRGPGAIGTAKAPLHWKERKAMYDAFLASGAALLPAGGGDMPLTNEDLIKIRDIVWQAPIPDTYTPNPNDTLPAYLSLAYATSHPAFARDRAVEARTAAVEARDAARLVHTEVATLRSALAKTTTGAATPLTADDIARLLREALAEVGPLYLTGRAPGTA
jgi:hypothetical protein